MSVIIDGSASVTINSGAVLGITSGTAVASTSGISIDFTSIPSWVKRLTIMFTGVSTNGTSQIQVQLGTSGGVVATGYLGSVDSSSTAVSAAAFTTGLALERSGGAAAANLRNGLVTFANLTSNTWAGSSLIGYSNTGIMSFSATSIPLGGTLDRVRITTVGSPATDTFDAGTINILYEG
jgi:hypothetical protein